ncbi:MAG: NAD(+) synthase [Bdellovibrionaceae bacterium]|nr:NAD(+) synthase [Pseudobdellovibrionaceae bacterium]
MKVALAQIQFRLGDFNRNYEKLLEALKKAKDYADILVFSEGGLWAYPPKDFLYQREFFIVQEKKIKQIQKKLPLSLSVLLPGFNNKKKELRNGVFLIKKNKIQFFTKEFLPDQNVFFESRYFKKGKAKDNFFYWNSKKIQILICEDFWHFSELKKTDFIIVVNASPYSEKKQKARIKRLKELVKKTKWGAVYLNLVGAQDSLIFDGASFALNTKGKKIWQGKYFEPDFILLNFPTKKNSSPADKILNLMEQKEKALILGIKEFFYQTGFSKACLGLSGGIDSALTAYLAMKALGKEKLDLYFLPSVYTQKISFKIIKSLSQNLKIKVYEKSITTVLNFCLKEFFNNRLTDIAKQNLQARLRMLFLMAKANEKQALLLGTGNKSELATGYNTLYGDLAGALCPIADLLKTEVYDLAEHINKKTLIFPKALLSREPSAELDYKQTDQDELPSYGYLDSFLRRFLEKKEPRIRKEKNLVYKIHSQEFKRKQAPPLLKLTENDLGESWRRPIAHQFYKN